MPFGLKNTPSTFQAEMNDVSREYLDAFVMVYIDDILIFSRTAEDHLKHLKLILARLRQHQLFAKRSKCEFNRASVPFLGHVVGQDGVEMQHSKVIALDDWPRFTTVTEVQSFLGLANYYCRFIRDFARVFAPLSELNRKGVPFEWGESIPGECFSEHQRCSQKRPSVATGGSLEVVHCNVRSE
jgi:Reverse transcriptase (RNA-dependent DNA polymerase)